MPGTEAKKKNHLQVPRIPRNPRVQDLDSDTGKRARYRRTGKEAQARRRIPRTIRMRAEDTEGQRTVKLSEIVEDETAHGVSHIKRKNWFVTPFSLHNASHDLRTNMVL